MAVVSITSVSILDNPSMYTNPLQFEIQYECTQHLQHDLEWKITYVGSAEDDRYDQVLDSVLVGPVTPGPFRFVFQADPPKWRDIPQDDILGVTVILLTCAYNNQEFIRVGYYVNNEYMDEALRECPPAVVAVDRVARNILADKPRVTRFPCPFDAPALPPGAEDAAAGVSSGFFDAAGAPLLESGSGFVVPMPAQQQPPFGFGGGVGKLEASYDGSELMMA